ncbi:MAG: FAD-dependent oxidoreductase [Candidatus Diapherotrites archaeon]|nr:FAD-dependent oxidoreductase [Candidatus Diapherotrites archaeon]
MTDFLFSLKERKLIAEETMAFIIDTSGNEYSFKAGQYADFTLENPSQTDSEGNTRAFSIASPPQSKGTIMFATRMRSTAFKNELKKMPLGAKIKVSQAMGSFTLHSDSSRPAVFLSGGIGITPVRSIIETATLEKKPHKIFLFYSNRTPAATAFLPDLENWQKQNKNFKMFATITDIEDSKWKYLKGRIDFAMLEKNVPKLKESNPIFYISGPPAMVAGLQKLLTDNGINEDNIRAEEFAGY